MHAQLLTIRQQVATLLKQVDLLIQSTPMDEPGIDPLEYRASPGGMLSDKGVEEMYRRFEAGEPDAVVAKAMSVSVQGVARRRSIWKKTT